jgi:hypothetical protein
MPINRRTVILAAALALVDGRAVGGEHADPVGIQLSPIAAPTTEHHGTEPPST